MTSIQEVLHSFGITDGAISEIRKKDGIAVCRVTGNRSSYVLKCFEMLTDRREIGNYRLLQALGIPTLQIIASTDSALLMEDIEHSDTLRLGRAEDMRNPDVAMRLARWYKQLHSSGKTYVAANGKGMYDETDVITLVNMDHIAMKTNTDGNPVWALLHANFAAVSAKIASIERTLAYNDFYFTNMIVAKDFSAAFMFDYNLLGKGYVYADIRNVTCSLGGEAKEAFLKEYGGFDPNESLVDDVASVLITLHFACCRDHFPNWAAEELEKVGDGTLEQWIKQLLAD